MTTINSYYLLIEGFAIAFFGIMAVQNLSHRDERLRMILGGILMYWTVEYLVGVLVSIGALGGQRLWSLILNTVDMTAEPTCCFLLIELCRPGWLTWRKVALNLAPFLVVGGVFIATGNQVWYWILLSFFMAYGCGVFVATMILIPRYNRFLKEHYSYEENVNLQWVYYVLLTFFALMFVYVACASFDTVIGDCVYMVGSIISWSMICYFIGRQETVLYELKATERERSSEATSIEAEPATMAPINFEKCIKERFIEPQLYLKPQLKLGDMAVAVGTNRTYLSRYLNETLHTTFYDYVNALRLSHAMELIENSNYSIQAIASIVGFNSYSTFRRTFIAKYNQSPQEYRNNHRQ